MSNTNLKSTRSTLTLSLSYKICMVSHEERKVPINDQ